MRPPVVAGIFVGGAATRMGGRPKGLLPSPEGGTLLERWLALLARADIARVVLVGSEVAREPYASFGVEAVDDEPPGIGPLGGLAGLLADAREGFALAFACDMPFVSSALVEALLAAPAAPIVAPRRAGLWEPLCARYDAPCVLPLARALALDGDYSLQRLLREAGARALPLSADEALQLRDWDAPEDLGEFGSA